MKRLRKLLCMTLVLVLCLGLLPVNGAAMVIQHNISAINSYRNLGINQSNLSKNLEKLSSGYKINRAGDDAAGLAISAQMRSQINAIDHAKDAVGLIQTAEGALTETHAMLQRMTNLLTQAENGTSEDKSAREAMQGEFSALSAEIQRIEEASNFNGIKLLTGHGGRDFSPELRDAAQKIVDGINAGRGSLGVIEGAINGNSYQRAKLRAAQNRLEDTIGGLKAAAENITAGESRIQDVDIAKEMTQFVKNNILLQAAQSMLAQANATPQSVLNLMDGPREDTGDEGKETSVDVPRTSNKEDKSQWDGIVTKDLLEKTLRETHGGTPSKDQPMSIYFQAAAVDGKNPRVVITKDALEALFSYNTTLSINTEFGSVSLSYEVLQALKDAGAAAMTVEIIPNEDGSVTFSILATDKDGNAIQGQIPVTLTLPTSYIQVGTYVAGPDGKAQPSSITSPNAGGMAALVWLDVDGTAQTFTVTTDKNTPDSEIWEENLFNRSQLLGLLPSGAADISFLKEAISKDDFIILLYLVHCNGQGAQSAADWFQGTGVTLPEGALTLEALLKLYEDLGFDENTIASVKDFLSKHFTAGETLTWGEALSAILNMAEMGCDPASGTLALAPYTARLTGAPEPEPEPEPGDSDSPEPEPEPESEPEPEPDEEIEEDVDEDIVEDVDEDVAENTDSQDSECA